MEKQCKVCGVVKALDDFYRSAGMKDGHRHDCKACNLAAKAARYRANPEPARQRVKDWQRLNPERYAANQARYRADGRKSAADRRSHLKRKFGITPEQYDEMLASQDGGCAICHKPPRADISLHVDHDHASGAVRGLLCFDCNAALGHLREDEERIRALRAYLLAHDPEVIELAALTRTRLAALSA
jgi:hypothetical protein